MKLHKKLILWIMIGGIVLSIGMPTVLIVQQLRQDSLDRALIQVVKRLDAPAVTRLLDQGASANARDMGEPPLTLTRLLARLLARLRPAHSDDVVARDAPALQVLLEDRRVCEPEYHTTIDIITIALIKHQANIHIPVWERQTPLHVATFWHLPQTVRLLVSKGADVNARDGEGDTPLAGADAEATMLLLEHGADVNAGSFGGKPLYCAALNTRPEVMKILMEHGADINPTDTHGFTSLFWLERNVRHGSPVIQLLKQHDARLNRKDQEALMRDVIPSM